MRLVILLSLASVFFSINLYALTLSGKVVDKDSDSPLSGVTIGIEELKIIVKTDVSGKFNFKNIKRGYYNLYIVHPEYGVKVITVRVKRNFEIDIEIEKKYYNLRENNNYYKQRSDRFGSHYITGKNIKDYPMRGLGDSLHLLQTLPGVGGGFSLATVPIVRGSNPLYDRYYIDDIAIDFPYHYPASIVPVISSVSEEIIDRATVIKGPYPLYYDDSIGSIIQIKTKDIDEPGVNGKLILDSVFPVLPTVHVTAVPFSDLSIMFTGRRTNIDLIVEAFKIDEAVDLEGNYFPEDFYFQDHFLKINYNLFSNHRLKFIFLGSDDYFSINKISTRSRYDVEAFKWEYLINKNIFLKTMFSRYRIEHDMRDDDTSITFNPLQYKFSQEINALFMNFYTKSGYEITIHEEGVKGNIDLSEIDDMGSLYDADVSDYGTFPIKGKSFSIFSEIGADYKPMWFNLGLRFKHYGPLSNNSLSYRAMGGMNISKTSAVYLGGGAYHAHPDMYYYLTTTGAEIDMEDSKSYTGVLGATSKLYKQITGQVELFYTYYKDLASRDEIMDAGFHKTLSQINPYSAEEKGSVYGAEFFLKGSYKFLYGWMSYTYSVSKRDCDKQDLNDYYSDFDQTHILRLVLAANFGKWTPSLIWHFYSSIPYTPVVDSVEYGDEYREVEGDYNSGRYPAHHRLDVKLTYTTDSKSRFYIEIWNCYLNEKNYVFHEFDHDKPHGDDNPEYTPVMEPSAVPPIFVWLGMEICF